MSETRRSQASMVSQGFGGVFFKGPLEVRSLSEGISDEAQAI